MTVGAGIGAAEGPDRLVPSEQSYLARLAEVAVTVEVNKDGAPVGSSVAVCIPVEESAKGWRAAPGYGEGLQDRDVTGDHRE